MTEPILSRLESARHKVEPDWESSDVERALDRVHVRIATKRRNRRIATSVAVLASVCALVAGGVRYGRSTAPTANSAAPALASVAAPLPESVLRYPDGSSATSITTATEMQVVEASLSRMITSLDRGSARFEIVPNPEREFRVRVAGVSLTVLGTIFTVERTEKNVHVAVERGRVRVETATASVILEAGQSGDYPIGVAPTASAMVSTTSSAPVKAAPSSWRLLAKNGKTQEAYAIVHELRAAQLRDAEELLAAADVARLAGHPLEAVPFLERVLSEYRADSRAPVAAFSLGRVLLSTRPADAASKFALARSLAPTGTLAEDALAHEVEAWSRAGNSAKARAAAEEYVKRYPSGTHIDQVKKHGGL